MTTLPDTYRDQIRLLIDSEPDPTLTDVLVVVPTPAPARRSRAVLAVASVALLVVLVAFGAVLVSRDDAPTGDMDVLTVAPTVPPSCVVGADNRGGCTVRPAKASRYLGFPPLVPTGVPAGWVLEHRQLRVYRDPMPNDQPPLPDGVKSVPTYNQVWTPPGTELAVNGTCPPYLQVRQRAVLPGEGAVPDVSAIDLGEGMTVYGSLAQTSGCGDQTIVFTSVNWVRDGTSFTVNASDVDREQMVRIVESLYDS